MAAMIAAATSPMDKKARMSGGEDVELKKPTSSSPLDEDAVDEGDVDVSVCKAIAGGVYVDRLSINLSSCVLSLSLG